jgi:hypothetical protein
MRVDVLPLDVATGSLKLIKLNEIKVAERGDSNPKLPLGRPE